MPVLKKLWKIYPSLNLLPIIMKNQWAIFSSCLGPKFSWRVNFGLKIYHICMGLQKIRSEWLFLYVNVVLVVCMPSLSLLCLWGHLKDVPGSRDLCESDCDLPEDGVLLGRNSRYCVMVGDIKAMHVAHNVTLYSRDHKLKAPSRGLLLLLPWINIALYSAERAPTYVGTTLMTVSPGIKW